MVTCSRVGARIDDELRIVFNPDFVKPAIIYARFGRIMPPIVSRKRLRTTLYDELDAVATPHSRKSGSVAPGTFQEESDSSLTSLSDEEFEPVASPKRQKVKPCSSNDSEDDKDDDDDDDIEFEDVAAPKQQAIDTPVASGDLELTLDKDTQFSANRNSLLTRHVAPLAQCNP
ncbi:hypothetical protein CDD81_5917 [Ophiocordyceps australis]|uniref:Uncharacterized protein n=1 Tax=Ophiocordyceps australis TaxID=1399860 RepID=A0A2C5YBA7_9HYPO|nr:hypothetical protein CDD81_5917 [Ophiocordyceps australis]